MHEPVPDSRVDVIHIVRPPQEILVHQRLGALTLLWNNSNLRKTLVLLCLALLRQPRHIQVHREWVGRDLLNSRITALYPSMQSAACKPVIYPCLLLQVRTVLR